MEIIRNTVTLWLILLAKKFSVWGDVYDKLCECEKTQINYTKEQE
jgi:hypothetical protein